MKSYKLISMEDLMSIATYMDKVTELFPIASIPTLNEMRLKSIAAMQNVQEAGNEGLIHAKLDAIVHELEKINGRARFVDEVAGPAPALYPEMHKQKDQSIGASFPRTVIPRRFDRPGVVEQTMADIDFDESLQDGE